MVRNSVKYTKEGSIRMIGARRNGDVVLAVRDTGPGIPEEALPRVAERFYRASDGEEGFGLGLAIVDSAMKVLGGELEIASSVGYGTTVTLKLPVGAHAGGDVTKVLVVDDEPALRDTLGYALRQEGFEVEVREDGDSGLAAALEDGIDLVILDLMLPGLPGTEVCRRLRAESAIPIVMLTARRRRARSRDGPRDRRRRLRDQAVLDGRAGRTGSRDPPPSRARP